MQVLVDTSIWIDFFNHPNSANAAHLQFLIEEDCVAICPPVHQEILQGMKSEKDLLMMEENLNNLIRLEADPFLGASGAAKLYQKLRKKGKTIRKSNDCLIAWYAIVHQIEIWHSDRDFDQIASQEKLNLYSPPLT
ncbi:type II toxin-antitoxin system VapC family toxin [Algoriphagus namhaensis]